MVDIDKNGITFLLQYKDGKKIKSEICFHFNIIKTYFYYSEGGMKKKNKMEIYFHCSKYTTNTYFCFKFFFCTPILQLKYIFVVCFIQEKRISLERIF